MTVNQMRDILERLPGGARVMLRGDGGALLPAQLRGGLAHDPKSGRVAVEGEDYEMGTPPEGTWDVVVVEREVTR